MSNCGPNGPDVEAITAHFNSLMAWNALPFLGPMLGPNVPGAAAALPPDGQDDLDTINANINVAVETWQSTITTVVGANTQNINSLVKILPAYIENATNLKLIPDEQNINILFVEFISLAIVMMIIIFFGIHK